MKEITIAKQPWLSFRRTASITIDGIRYRLFRASVTVAVITLAVAFLMNILSESLIKRNVASKTREQIRVSRQVYDWSSRLSSPGSMEDLLDEIAASEQGTPQYIEAQDFAKLSDTEMLSFREWAAKASSVMQFFDGLDYAKRRSMIHTAEGLGILKRLKEAEAMATFRQALSRIKSVRFVMGMDELDALLAAFDSNDAIARKILDARAKAIREISSELDARSIIEALCDSEGAFGDKVRAMGFRFPKGDEATGIANQAKSIIRTLNLEKTIDVRVTENDGDSQTVRQPFRQLLAQQANVLPADVNAVLMWKYMAGRKFAAKYLQKMKEVEAVMKGNGASVEGISPKEIATEGIDADVLSELADSRVANAALLRAERLTVDAGKGFLGLGERLAWLLFVSMLVCGIGITNAMMMSVTERFKEIATLKCLGALDGFIMLMFVLESCVMGLVGGCIGSVLGGLIGVCRMLFSLGFRFIGAFPAGDMLLGMLASILIGTLLAAISAVIPSYKAARLAPMEAMRVE
ncbi:MAG: FtsX-like permease family protein [Victivallales bacterium]|nr:FtsX-like permease family protein [Victivallales bacterium]